MKQLFKITLMLLASITITSTFANNPDTEKEVHFIVVTQKTESTDIERTLNNPIFNARFDTLTHDVNFQLYNIGIAHLYIIDNNGNIIDNTTVDTDSPVYATLSTEACNGSFYVVIDTSYIYAEGIVLL